MSVKTLFVLSHCHRDFPGTVLSYFVKENIFKLGDFNLIGMLVAIHSI